MIDFIRFTIDPERVPSGLLNHPLLENKSLISANVTTGEVTKESRTYRGLTFDFYISGRLRISGSLHKYFNEGVHNFNDFTYPNLMTVIDEINDKFSIDPSFAIIRNIEFGLNITPPINPTTIVSNLLTHKMKPFNWYSISGAKYKQAIHGKYYVKCYNKGLQYRGKSFVGRNNKLEQFEVPGEVLRFELKFIKMTTPNRLGIFTLDDLTNKSKLQLALELVLDEWNNVLMYDPTIKPKQLSKYIKSKKLWQWQNVNFWSGHIEKNQRWNEKSRMNEIIRKYSDQIHKKTYQALKDKAESLFHFRVPMTLKSKGDKNVPMTPSYIGVDSTLSKVDNYCFRNGKKEEFWETDKKGRSLSIIPLHFDVSELMNNISANNRVAI